MRILNLKPENNLNELQSFTQNARDYGSKTNQVLHVWNSFTEQNEVQTGAPAQEFLQVFR